MERLANKRRELFCREYVGSAKFHGTRAAIASGYSARTADKQASRLLSLADVIARVTQLKEERWQALQMSDAELKARIAATARFDPRKLVDVDGQSIPLHLLDDETAWALAAVDMEERLIQDEDGDEKSVISVRTKKYRAADKGKAQEMLARMANLFKADTSNAADAAVDAFAQVLGQVIGTRSGIAGLVQPALPDAGATASQV